MRIKRDIREALTFHAHETIFCKKCKRKTKGIMFVSERQPLPSIETGKTAYPYIWVCDNSFKHIRRVGYTLPVDFNQIRGRPDNQEDGLPDFNASDEVWEEWADEKIREYEKMCA